MIPLAYVLIHSRDDGTAFTNEQGNEQWNKPLIIRCNGKESHVRIIVDKAKQIHTLDINEIKPAGVVSDADTDTYTDTEIEVFLPLIVNLAIHDIENLCRLYPLPTTDISFKFHLVDNSKPKAKEEVQCYYRG